MNRKPFDYQAEFNSLNDHINNQLTGLEIRKNFNLITGVDCTVLISSEKKVGILVTDATLAEAQAIQAGMKAEGLLEGHEYLINYGDQKNVPTGSPYCLRFRKYPADRVMGEFREVKIEMATEWGSITICLQDGIYEKFSPRTRAGKVWPYAFNHVYITAGSDTIPADPINFETWVFQLSK